MVDKYTCKGKRLDNGEWIEGFLYRTDTDAFILTSLSTFSDGFMQAFGEAVDPDTVGRCTGLPDKNGKLIFEGDIIRFGVMTRRVGWHVYQCRFEAIDSEGYGSDLWGMSKFARKANADGEIIGNIHDNPELLQSA